MWDSNEINVISIDPKIKEHSSSVEEKKREAGKNGRKSESESASESNSITITSLEEGYHQRRPNFSQGLCELMSAPV